MFKVLVVSLFVLVAFSITGFGNYFKSGRKEILFPFFFMGGGGVFYIDLSALGF